MALNYEWTFTNIGFLIWGSVCLIGAVCMIFLRSKPSNGLCLVYLQYLCAHTIFVPIILINNSLGNDDQLTKRILNMCQDMILALAGTVYFRIGNILWFKYRSPVHIALETVAWTTMLLIWVVIVVLHFAVEQPTYSQYVYAVYYSLAAVFAYVALIREMLPAIRGHNSPSFAEGYLNANSIFAGSSRLLFTVLGFVAGTWGMVDWVIIIVSSFGVPIWEPSFLSRLFDSLFYVPPIVLFMIWWDCPVNVKTNRETSNTANRNDLDLSK